MGRHDRDGGISYVPGIGTHGVVWEACASDTSCAGRLFHPERASFGSCISFSD